VRVRLSRPGTFYVGFQYRRPWDPASVKEERWFYIEASAS
jgi:hypothetical protein